MPCFEPFRCYDCAPMPFGRRDTTLIEKRLGHRFKRLDLLELSLTHRSWANEQGIPEHYERLEFLGDSVLGLITAEWLYKEHPELPEGELLQDEGPARQP